MVPSEFVFIDEMPLTPNGKIDKKVLRELQGVNFTNMLFVPVKTEIERAIASVWRRVLNLNEVGTHTNFFDLGGHSLLLMEVYSQLKDNHKKLTIIDLFEYPTINTLADYLSQA